MFLLNKQEVFDKIITGLRRQGKKSQNDNGLCLYRGEDNCKCAVGHIIPDELYHPSMEGWGAGQSYIQRILLSVADPSTSLLISDMQFIHDQISIDQWEREFRVVSQNYNLIYV